MLCRNKMFFLLFCFASVASSAQDDIRRAYENIWDMSKEEIKKHSTLIVQRSRSFCCVK